jgi:hypothetical protein
VTRQPRLLSLALVFLVLFVILVSNNFVGPVLAAIEAGDDRAYADAMLFNLLGLGLIVAVLAGGLLTMMPAAIRRREVRRSVSASGVLLATGRGNIDLRRALRAGDFFAGRRVKKRVPGWTFTLTADAAGVRFWVGMFRPTTIVELPWAEVERVTTGRVEVGLRHLAAIAITMRSEGPEGNVLLFALGGEGLLTGFPRGRGAVAEVAKTLEELRVSGVAAKVESATD